MPEVKHLSTNSAALDGKPVRGWPSVGKFDTHRYYLNEQHLISGIAEGDRITGHRSHRTPMRGGSGGVGGRNALFVKTRQTRACQGM